MLIINEVNSHLLAFFETGTEGTIWSIYTDDQGYDGLYGLKNNDELIVYTKDRCAIVWRGIIQLEYERLYQPYPANPEYGQQLIFNRWVHGFQVGLEPYVWAKWFFDELPATLKRNEPVIYT